MTVNNSLNCVGRRWNAGRLAAGCGTVAGGGENKRIAAHTVIAVRCCMRLESTSGGREQGQELGESNWGSRNPNSSSVSRWLQDLCTT